MKETMNNNVLKMVNSPLNLDDQEIRCSAI